MVWGFGVTPAKAMPTFWKPWQVEQPLKMPVCDISVPENVVKLLEEWQVSHGILVGRWLDGLDTGELPKNDWPLWQVAQPLTIPVCDISVPENVVKLLEEWQVSHGILLGKWFTGLAFGVTPVKV